MKQADAHDILNYHDWDLRKFGACLRGWGASKQRYSCLRSRVNRLGKFTGPDSIFMQMQNRRLKAQWVGRYKWLDDHLQLSGDTDLAHSCHLCIHGDRLDIPEHPTSCLSDRGRERERDAPSDLTVPRCLMLTKCCKNQYQIVVLCQMWAWMKANINSSRKKVINVIISSCPIGWCRTGNVLVQLKSIYCIYLHCMTHSTWIPMSLYKLQMDVLQSQTRPDSVAETASHHSPWWRRSGSSGKTRKFKSQRLFSAHKLFFFLLH